MTMMMRPLKFVAVALAGLALVACANGPTRPRPVAAPPPAPEDALAAYRTEIEQADAQTAQVTPEQIEAYRRMTEAKLGPGVIDNFELFMFINKAAEGPTAQHAFLFTRGSGGSLEYLDTWLVSTGREQRETSPKGASKFTTTPSGVFQFDVNHFSRLHKSNAWEADMPWAMFLRTRSGGPTTGIALHAALDKYIHNLGQRASAGCIRLLPSNAEKLYKRLQKDLAGTVPVTVDSGGTARMTGGRTRGTRALVIVDDVPDSRIYASGSSALVAAAD